jgi:hypothetical protein
MGKRNNLGFTLTVIEAIIGAIEAKALVILPRA